MNTFEFRWRSFCWYEGIKQWSPGYQGAVWLWHYRQCKAQLEHNRDRDVVMRALSA